VSHCRLLTWLAALAVWTAPALAQTRVPYVPADDSVVLEHVAPPRAPGVQQLRELRAQWQADPRNYAAALAYARTAVDVGRQEDDPRYFGYAESVLQPWLEQAQAPPEVRLLNATLRQGRKDFPGARHELDAVIAGGGPEVPQAQLARATLLLIEGDPAGALQDCVALTARVDAVSSGICRAAALGLGGHAAESLDLLQALRRPSQDAPLQVQVWLLGTAAGLEERLGRFEAARADYAEAQRRLEAAATRDPGLLAAYADCLLQHAEPAAVEDLLAADGRIDSLLLRLALAEQMLGRAGSSVEAAKAAEHARLLGQRFAEARQRGDALHLREEALYQLALENNPALALQLAQQDWQQQREPIDARILLRAALAAGQADAARPVLQWLQQTALEDAYLAPLVQRLRQERP
jgi:hypothetical protein